MVENNRTLVQTAEQEKPPAQIISGRPALIRVFGIFVLLVSLFNLLHFIQVLSRWFVLSTLPLTLPPAFLAAEGLFWFLAGIILFRGIWKGRSWARPAGMALSILFSLSHWAIRIWLAPGADLALRWPADLFFTLLGLGLASLALNLPASKLYFN